MPDENDSSATEAVRQDRRARQSSASLPGFVGGAVVMASSGIVARVYVVAAGSGHAHADHERELRLRHAELRPNDPHVRRTEYRRSSAPSETP
jgi:hypothetical protein